MTTNPAKVPAAAIATAAGCAIKNKTPKGVLFFCPGPPGGLEQAHRAGSLRDPWFAPTAFHQPLHRVTVGAYQDRRNAVSPGKPAAAPPPCILYPLIFLIFPH